MATRNVKPWVAILALGTLGLSWTVQADHGPSEKTLTEVESWDGHKVPITIYRPLDADHQVPVILHSHGWSGTRQTSDGAFHDFIAAGFGVVSIDMRGHGDARLTSEARVHHMQYEIRDVQAVIDHVATLPWVLLDGPGDPRLGAIGGSYGGGYQLLTAAVDDRLDALAPEITWNRLPQSLLPNGAPKSAWIDLLYGAGNAFARVHPTIHEAFAYLQATNQAPDGSVPGTTNLIAQFTDSSPASYPATINVPTLLIQGMPDTLFNFNQAAANYEQIKATGAHVRLVTHLGGHILNTQGTIPVPAPTPLGLQPPAGGTPCGSNTAQAVAWFQRWLLGDTAVETGPEVCLALDDGTVITGPHYPLPGTQSHATHAEGPFVFAQGVPGVETRLDVIDANTPTIVAGVPRVSGHATVLGADAILFWKLVVVDGATGAERVLDSQVTPLRIAGVALGAQAFSVDLGGVAAKLNAGDALQLVANNVDLQFGHNGERAPGGVIVHDVRLDLPVLASVMDAQMRGAK